MAHQKEERMTKTTVFAFLLLLAPLAYAKSRSSSSNTPHHSVRMERNENVKRSLSARAAFMHENPCPSTGRTQGKSPGWVVAYILPPACGGADSPSNMLWRTVEAAKQDRNKLGCR